MRKVLYLFGELSDSDIDWLASAGARKEVSEGAVLVHEGKPINEIYVLLEGRLSVRLRGLKEEITTLWPGEIVGELSFLDSRPPNATVAVSTVSTVLAIPRNALSEKLKQDCAFAARFYHALGVFLANRLRQTVNSLGFERTLSLEPDEEEIDELDPQLLESLTLAAKRFDYLRDRLGEK